MSDDPNAGVVEILTPVLLSFPNLEAARPFMRNGKVVGEPKYGGSLEMLPDHPQLAALKKRAADVARAKWPSRPFTELSFPFVGGDKLADKAKVNKKDREWSRGMVVLTARSKFQPKLAAIVNGQIVDLSDDNKATMKAKFFTGAEVLAQVNFVAYDEVGEGGRAGVTAYLNMVLATGKGKRLTGGATASEVFKGYAGSVSAEDPTKGLDNSDDIPF